MVLFLRHRSCIVAPHGPSCVRGYNAWAVCGGMRLCVTVCRCVARGRGGLCLFGLLQRSFTHMMFVHVRGYATACRGKWTAADCR